MLFFSVNPLKLEEREVEKNSRRVGERGADG
jgi:hypothetical protein